MDTFYAAAAPYVHGFYIAYAQSARAGRRGTQESGDGDPRPSSRAKTSGRAGPGRARTRGRGDVGCSRILEPGREIDRDT